MDVCFRVLRYPAVVPVDDPVVPLVPIEPEVVRLSPPTPPVEGPAEPPDEDTGVPSFVCPGGLSPLHPTTIAAKSVHARITIDCFILSSSHRRRLPPCDC